VPANRLTKLEPVANARLVRCPSRSCRVLDPSERLKRVLNGSARATLYGNCMTDLTTVELLWHQKRIENWIRFGQPVAETIVDRHRRILSFAAGSIFAFVRWTSNDFGTVLSRIDILRAAVAGKPYSTVPWIKPGGESLLRLSGWPKVERVLGVVDAVEALGINPGEVAPEYWHHVHNRLSVNEKPRAYTRARHQAWLHRRRLTL
jgi:uncharacterized protein DUF2840